MLPRNLQEIIAMNETLFKPQLGCCTSFKATLRKLPFALSAELDRLEKKQVIQKVTHSDWAASIVVVRKPNEVRLCGDFRVTLNPSLMFIDFHSQRNFSQIEGWSQVCKT